MREIVVIAHDIRSTHNVGALLRTADGLGVNHVYFTGYTPYPNAKNDDRLPYIATKLDKQIHKTALGAENSVAWSHKPDIETLIATLKKDGFEIAALEQAANSTSLPKFKPAAKTALLLGREVEGIEKSLITHCDITIEIPMNGTKESLNVVQAAAIALYHIAYFPFT